MLLDQFSSFLQVVLVDLVLAGDNAIVIGMVAATVATTVRRRVIVIGIAMAALMRVGFGLALSIILMAFGASVVARALERFHWISYIGLAVILYVALSMIWVGASDLGLP